MLSLTAKSVQRTSFCLTPSQKSRTRRGWRQAVRGPEKKSEWMRSCQPRGVSNPTMSTA